MTDEAFNRYVRRGASAAVIPTEQPYVQMRGGAPHGPCIGIVNPELGTAQALRIGTSDLAREARELARQLLLAADEIERRGYE